MKFKKETGKTLPLPAELCAPAVFQTPYLKNLFEWSAERIYRYNK